MSLRGLRVLITSGPTREYLDPIRYLTNASSGRMGAALARQALKRGADVALIAGPSDVAYPGKAKLVRVTTGLEMLRATLARSSRADVVIAAAAVSDWRFARTSSRKIKRKPGALRLTLKPNPDIIKAAARRRRAGQLLVGFALETHDRLAHAAAKMKAKGLDLIVANGPRALGAGKSSATLLGRGGFRKEIPPRAKDALASAVLDAVEALR